MKQLQIRRKRNKFILSVLFVVVSFFIWESMEIMGKYYATKNNKGVAVASGLYFNSDKLNKKTGVATGIDDITVEEINNLAIFTNSSSWSNGAVELPLKIQNYDSNILFNDSGLDVSYRIQFKLLDTPQGASYSIVDKDSIAHSLSQKNEVYESSGTLLGGSMVADTYWIKINLTGQVADYQPSRILVLAYPTAPDYLVNEDEQQYRLLGIFEGHTNEMELEIDSAGFLVEKEFGNNDVNWKRVVEYTAAYIYNFKTKGDVVQDSSTVSKREVQINWRSDYLGLDKYSEYYDSDKISTKKENNITWKMMNIEVLPYTSINLTFYKKEAFINALGDGGDINSADDFRNLVQVTIVTQD